MTKLSLYYTLQTQEEFHSLYLSSVDMKLDEDTTFREYPMDVTLPDHLDWREKNVVTPVRLYSLL